MEKLESLEQACSIEGIDPKKVIPEFEYFPEKDRKSMRAHAMIVIITRAANRLANKGEEWVPDFDDRHQYKYEVWFRKGSSGFRFGGYVGWHSHSIVGSRLCFINSEVAEQTVNQFEELFNDWLI